MSKPIPPNPNLSTYDPYVQSLEDYIEHLEGEITTYHTIISLLGVALVITSGILIYVLA